VFRCVGCCAEMSTYDGNLIPCAILQSCFNMRPIAYRLDRPNRTHTHMSSSTVHAHTNQGVWKGKGENIDSVRPSHTRLREAAM